MRKRWAACLAIAGVLGFLTAVAVAWAGALDMIVRRPHDVYMGVRQGDPSRGETAGRDIRALRWRRIGGAAYETQWLPSVKRRDLEPVVKGERITAYPPPEEVIPRWARAQLLPWSAAADRTPLIDQPGTAVDPFRYGVVGGFPAPALWHEVGGLLQPNRVRGGLDLSPLFGAPVPGNRRLVLPLRPVWWGLLLNTLAYATIWAAAIMAVGASRRAVRRLRGQCPRCAYDLGALPEGAPCPECGERGPSGSPPPRPSGC